MRCHPLAHYSRRPSPRRITRRETCHCARTMTRRRGSRLSDRAAAFASARARWRAASLVMRCILHCARAWEWDSDEAADIPSYRRGRALHPGRYPTARPQVRCRRCVFETVATVSDSTLRTRSIQSNCRDRRSIGHCFLSLRRACARRPTVAVPVVLR